MVKEQELITIKEKYDAQGINLIFLKNIMSESYTKNWDKKQYLRYGIRKSNGGDNPST